MFVHRSNPRRRRPARRGWLWRRHTDGKDQPAPAVPPRPRTDKSQYNLFNPALDDLLRTFSSSRPDQTTGPHSVDAGHFYLETGVSYGLDLGATRTDTWTAFQSTHVRAGLFVGVRYRPLPNLQFDAGCNFGVSADATDDQPFAGIVVRF